MDHEQQAGWMIRTDADGDLTNSLDHCLTMLALAQGDLRNWKWVVIAAYSAAQTAMVMVLEDRGEWKHLKPEDRKELLNFFAKMDTEEALPGGNGGMAAMSLHRGFLLLESLCDGCRECARRHRE